MKHYLLYGWAAWCNHEYINTFLQYICMKIQAEKIDVLDSLTSISHNIRKMCHSID